MDRDRLLELLELKGKIVDLVPGFIVQIHAEKNPPFNTEIIFRKYFGTKVFILTVSHEMCMELMESNMLKRYILHKITDTFGEDPIN